MASQSLARVTVGKVAALALCSALSSRADAQLTIPVRLVAADGGGIAPLQASTFIGDGDIVVFVAANDIAHACDDTGTATKVRVRFDDVSPAPGTQSLSASVPSAGASPVALPLQIAAPLAPRRYGYTVELAAGSDVLCSVRGALVKPVTLSVGVGSGFPRVDDADQRVNDGDTVVWTIENEAAHQCDLGKREVRYARISFSGLNPLAQGGSLTVDIPGAGEGDVSVTTRLADALAAGTYDYRVDFYNQFDRLQCSALASLVKPGVSSRMPRPRPPRPPRPSH